MVDTEEKDSSSLIIAEDIVTECIVSDDYVLF